MKAHSARLWLRDTGLYLRDRFACPRESQFSSKCLRDLYGDRTACRECWDECLTTRHEERTDEPPL